MQITNKIRKYLKHNWLPQREFERMKKMDEEKEKVVQRRYKDRWLIITCPCKFPLWEVDKRIPLSKIDYNNEDMIIYWMPDDEEYKKPIKVEEVLRVNKPYISTIFKDPLGASVKSYIVNGHFVYAGCSYEELVQKGNGMSCTEKVLYATLHPKKEWEASVLKDGHMIRR